MYRSFHFDDYAYTIAIYKGVNTSYLMIHETEWCALFDFSC